MSTNMVYNGMIWKNASIPDGIQIIPVTEANYLAHKDEYDAMNAIIRVVDGGGSAGILASDISYDGTTSGLSATNAQAAIDELASGSAGALSELTDVQLSSPSNGQSLVYDTTSGKWVNGESIPDMGDMAEVDYDVVYDTEDTDFNASVIPCDNGMSNVQSALNEIRETIAENPLQNYVCGTNKRIPFIWGFDGNNGVSIAVINVGSDVLSSCNVSFVSLSVQGVGVYSDITEKTADGLDIGVKAFTVSTLGTTNYSGRYGFAIVNITPK